MAELATYLANKLLDHAIGRTSFTMPTVYLALLKIRDQSNNLRSTAVSIGDFTIPATPNGRLYRCTTGGTTGAGEPTWATTDGGTTADGGTVVWTEHTPSLKAQTNIPECAYTSYARVALGTGGSSAFGAAASGSSTNSGSAVNFATKTGGTDENVAGWATFDALTVGNMLEFGLLTSAPFMKKIQDNDTPSFGASQLTRSAT
jgi:hypothetical protein